MVFPPCRHSPRLFRAALKRACFKSLVLILDEGPRSGVSKDDVQYAREAPSSFETRLAALLRMDEGLAECQGF